MFCMHMSIWFVCIHVNVFTQPHLSVDTFNSVFFYGVGVEGYDFTGDRYSLTIEKEVDKLLTPNIWPCHSRNLSSEARVQSQGSPNENCSESGARFPPNTLTFPCQSQSRCCYYPYNVIAIRRRFDGIVE